jgi:hypothetical protein
MILAEAIAIPDVSSHVIVGVVSFISTIGGALLFGKRWFDGQVRAWLAGEEGRKLLFEDGAGLFWQFLKTEGVAKWVEAKAEHKANNAVAAVQLNLDRTIREVFAELEKTLRADREEDRKQLRQIERRIDRLTARGHDRDEPEDTSPPR